MSNINNQPYRDPMTLTPDEVVQRCNAFLDSLDDDEFDDGDGVCVTCETNPVPPGALHCKACVDEFEATRRAERGL